MMKTKKLFCALFVYISIYTLGYSNNDADSLGLPGDNLDLHGVLELFKKSDNPEEFEKALNKEDNKLNNLDLNGDGEVDYIRVIDHTDGDAHAIVLQVPVNENEAQDVAVIEIEKKADGTAHLQIIGDEDLYGKDYIIEPADPTIAKDPDPAVNKSNTTVVVNVWGWPSVRYLYGPGYTVWVSPWRWAYYPIWWKPWRPVYWRVYHPYWRPYHVHHHRAYTHRVVHAHRVYHGHRMASKTVYQRRGGPAPARQVNAPRGQNQKQVNKTQKVRRQPGTSPQKSGRQQKRAAKKPSPR